MGKACSTYWRGMLVGIRWEIQDRDHWDNSGVGFFLISWNGLRRNKFGTSGINSPYTGRSSSFGIATCYVLDHRGVAVRVPLG
jgi:hypothetical protein